MALQGITKTTSKFLTNVQKPENGLLNWMLTEIVGNATPKVLLVRSFPELLDEALTQYGGDIVFVGGANLFNKVLGKAPEILKLPTTGRAQEWANATRSIATLTALSAGYFSLPNFRNYITLRVCGTRDYAEMIGVKKRKKKSDAALNHEADAHLKKGLLPLAVEAGLLAILLPTAVMAMKKGAELPEVMRLFQVHLGLKDGELSNIQGRSYYIFWGLAAYTAFGLASTDKYDKQEVFLKAVAFTMGFQVVPKVLRPALEKFVAGKKIPDFIGSEKNAVFASEYLSKVLTLGFLPPLLNIYLTHKRIEREDAAKVKMKSALPDVKQVIRSHTITPVKKQVSLAYLRANLSL